MAWEARGKYLVWPNAGTGHIEDFLWIRAPHGVEFTDATTVSPAVDILLDVHKLTAGQPVFIGSYATLASAKTASGH